MRYREIGVIAITPLEQAQRMALMWMAANFDAQCHSSRIIRACDRHPIQDTGGCHFVPKDKQIMKLIKTLCALFFLMLGTQAKADCQDSWLEYHSNKLILSVVYSEGCYQGEMLLQFTHFSGSSVKRGEQTSEMKSLPFDQECTASKKLKNGDTVEFTCRKNGVSPLAGATFRYRKFKTSLSCEGVELPDIEHAFVCIKGCKRDTPRKLIIQVGEGCA